MRLPGLFCVLISLLSFPTQAIESCRERVKVLYQAWPGSLDMRIRLGLLVEVEAEKESVAIVKERFREAFNRTVSDAGITGQKAVRLELAFQSVSDELVSNARKHGARSNQLNNISVRLVHIGHQVELEVRDHSGSFYDPKDSKDPANQFRVNTPADLDRIDDIRALRQRTHHDPERPDGDGGTGIFGLEGGWAQSLVWEPNTQDGKIVGTCVRARWTLEK